LVFLAFGWPFGLQRLFLFFFLSSSIFWSTANFAARGDNLPWSAFVDVPACCEPWPLVPGRWSALALGGVAVPVSSPSLVVPSASLSALPLAGVVAGLPWPGYLYCSFAHYLSVPNHSVLEVSCNINVIDCCWGLKSLTNFLISPCRT
jgi:hypothetical protein